MTNAAWETVGPKKRSLSFSLAVTIFTIFMFKMFFFMRVLTPFSELPHAIYFPFHWRLNPGYLLCITLCVLQRENVFLLKIMILSNTYTVIEMLVNWHIFTCYCSAKDSACTLSVKDSACTLSVKNSVRLFYYFYIMLIISNVNYYDCND